MCSRVLASWGGIVICSRGVVRLWVAPPTLGSCEPPSAGRIMGSSPSLSSSNCSCGLWKSCGPTFTTLGGWVTWSSGALLASSSWVWPLLVMWLWGGGSWVCGREVEVGRFLCERSTSRLSITSKLVFQTNTYEWGGWEWHFFCECNKIEYRKKGRERCFKFYFIG